MAGALTVTLVGSYATVALAIAAMDAETITTVATDSVQLHIDPDSGKGFAKFHVVKYIVAP